ncbi:DUF4276 family protein [Proteus hauseri]|uniref:DUF4276 family protein n=1 Tax=Proteus hauseri TaxID=183417 RepID=UPI0032DB1B80
MTLVHVICEGQTEEAFVQNLLVEPFAHKGIYLIPALIGRPGHKGGNFKFDRLYPDIKNRLLADKNCYCTTFFDYYGLPESFPGKIASSLMPTMIDKARELQDILVQKLTEKLGEQAMLRFIPYIQMYEFEALLFSNTQKMAQGMDKFELADTFSNILREFDSPEHINNSPQTAPSKRIENLIQGYEKPLLGILAALEVGLDSMRENCSLFNHWLTEIESLS